MDNKKIAEAQDILKKLGLPVAQQNRMCALTLLALCHIRPDDRWDKAERDSMILATEIMEFMKVHYDADYKYGTRESIRKEALNPFVLYGLVDKNPDDPDLPTNSPNTHYAISVIAVDAIKRYLTPEWDLALQNFLENRFSYATAPVALVRSIHIKNFKSIVDETIELGRFNVFIGVNGCGKTNILEAIATAGAEVSNDLTFEGLNSRGVRIARPNLIISSFRRTDVQNAIDISLDVQTAQEQEKYKYSIAPQDPNDIYTRWSNLAEDEAVSDVLFEVMGQIMKEYPGISGEDLVKKANETLSQKSYKRKGKFDTLLSEYAIFDVVTKSLRGIAPADSKKTPLGINGEGLDLLIGTFNAGERELLSSCHTFFDWLEEVIADKEDKLKLSGLRAGRSISTLYFRDKYMSKKNNTLSAENSNEGVLHILFYLALFISARTPRFFGIDNIETALNPRLCQVLITELVKLSKETQKQVLITTHNPAVLDGLNLLDDDQRLFEVYRDAQGHTRTRRKKFKADLSDKKYKLSDMWLKGLLGAVPENF